MKTKTLILLMAVVGFMACRSQDSKSVKSEVHKIKPHENIVVNKKYDDNGNLIAFDSTYTFYYSSNMKDSINMDTLLKKFREFYGSSIVKPGKLLNEELDSIVISRFFHKDPLIYSFYNEKNRLEEALKSMDSLQMSIFREFMKNSETM
jgi:hypothetical protein